MVSCGPFPALIPGPTPIAWASAFMIFAYLDEFGHIGPFFSRGHARHNTSPVFGLAGVLLPEQSIRPFATFFLQKKAALLREDPTRGGRPFYEWEKKGTNLFTAKSVLRYPTVRGAMFTLLNEVHRQGGHTFYYGREKFRCIEDGNPIGLYKTVLAYAIRRIDAYCAGIGQNFIVVLDQNSARRELLETAAKTMFGASPARHLSSPPFEVESCLNQNMQAADWVSAVVGRIFSRRLDPEGFDDYAAYDAYFWDRLQATSTHSEIYVRRRRSSAVASHGPPDPS